MNILELLKDDGLEPRRAASTNGGEYCAPCPACGGRDRFRIWPAKAETGRYWCRGCNKSGDAVQYFRDFHGLSFREAAEQVGKPISSARNNRQVIRNKNTRCPNRSTRQPQRPDEQWATYAQRMVDKSHSWLMSNKKALDWLQEKRGLSADTVKRHRLGWLHKDFYVSREQWGLSSEMNAKDQPKKLFFPAGLVIPCFAGNTPVRIRIRRTDDSSAERWGRYYVLPGSSMQPMVISPGSSKAEEYPAIIVESELDAILLKQEITESCTVVAMGSAQAKPPDGLARLLQAVPYVIIALDADQAGNRATRYWCDTFRNAVWFPMLRELGKDPTEARLNGLDLNVWFAAAKLAVTKALEDTESPKGVDIDYGPEVGSKKPDTEPLATKKHLPASTNQKTVDGDTPLCQPLAPEPDTRINYPLPAIIDGVLRIPFDCAPKHRWWAGGQSIFETLLELDAPDEVIEKYISPVSNPSEWRQWKRCQHYGRPK
ncbi:primase-helicase zinc-binding domain-containing protein [Desulfolithobacter sp.]